MCDNSFTKVPCYLQSIEQVEDMNETPRERSHVAEYQKEIQDLRGQIQKLQEAGNVGEYSGREPFVDQSRSSPLCDFFSVPLRL